MSYDIYCYQPTSSEPNAAEAESVISSEGKQSRQEGDESAEMKQRLAAALIACNSGLKPFEFDYGEIAKFKNISKEQARAEFTHIELNPAEGDLALQLTIFEDNVSIAIPYWYTGTKADQVFNQLEAYLHVIRKTAGYFVYDPQTGKAFDPDAGSFGSHEEYEKIVTSLSEVAKGAAQQKPWWKFW